MAGMSQETVLPLDQKEGIAMLSKVKLGRQGTHPLQSDVLFFLLL